MKEFSHDLKHHSPHMAVHAMKGHPAMALLGAGVWAVGKAVTAIRKDWRCNNCGHRFN